MPRGDRSSRRRAPRSPATQRSCAATSPAGPAPTMPMLGLRVTGAARGRQVAPSLSITKRFRFRICTAPVAVDTPAGGLTGGVAYPAADGAEGIGGGDRLEGALVVLVPDGGDVGRRIGADRTGDLARSGDVVDVAGVVLVLRRRVGHQDAVDVLDRHQPNRTRRSGVFAPQARLVGQAGDLGRFRGERDEVVAAQSASRISSTLMRDRSPPRMSGWRDGERKSMPEGMPRMRASSGVTIFAMSWPQRPGFAPFTTGCNRKGPEVRRGRCHFAAARNRS